MLPKQKAESRKDPPRLGVCGFVQLFPLATTRDKGCPRPHPGARAAATGAGGHRAAAPASSGQHLLLAGARPPSPRPTSAGFGPGPPLGRLGEQAGTEVRPGDGGGGGGRSLRRPEAQQAAPSPGLSPTHPQWPSQALPRGPAPSPLQPRSAPAGRGRGDLPGGWALAEPRGAARIPPALLLRLDGRSGSPSPRARGVGRQGLWGPRAGWRGRVGRLRAGCSGRASARIQPGRSRGPAARSRRVAAGALPAMGRGAPRARGSRACLLLLLLRLPWPVWGAEAFQGEWDVPRGAGEVAVRHRGGWEGREGLRRTCAGTLSCPGAGLGAQTDTLCATATVAMAKRGAGGSGGRSPLSSRPSSQNPLPGLSALTSPRPHAPMCTSLHLHP